MSAQLQTQAKGQMQRMDSHKKSPLARAFSFQLNLLDSD
jgi:hypothetical protein